MSLGHVYGLGAKRHLTAATKRVHLREWATLCAALPRCQPTDRGGRGYPDAEIVPWCARINALEGICTMQSCAGHAYPDGSRTAAHLWLWLDARRSRAFDAAAFRLARRTRYIEGVSRLYMADGKEIASITFGGNERDSLRASMRLVLAFLRVIATSYRSRPTR